MEIGDYERLDEIGRGAFGVVYRAEHLQTGRRVAVKELAVSEQRDWEPMERFEREAKALRSVDHPGIVGFVDAFEARSDRGLALYIVAEALEGPTLQDLIDEGERWDEDRARSLIESLLETVAYLHGLSPRIVHRDIKPANIVMRDGTDPVLIDFGAVVDAAPASDGTVSVAGTAGYMAPEQAMGAKDPRSDLYAVGATVLHALTHVHPVEFPRDGLRLQLRDRLGTSDAFVEVLERLLEPDPEQRFADAEEALAALRADPDDPGSDASSSSRALAKVGSTALVATPRPVDAAVRRVVLDGRTPVGGAAMGLVLLVGTLLPILLLFTLSGYLAAFAPLTMLPTMGLGYLAVRARSRERMLALYRNGTTTEGTVQSIQSHQRGHTVKYSYEVEGVPLSGAFGTSEFTSINNLDRGDTLTVLYDPRARHRSIALTPADLRAIGD